MIKYFIIAFLTCVSAQSFAQSATPLSMNDCMEYALKHNYAIKNAAIDVLIQKAQNDQTIAAAYPHINGKAEGDYFYIPQVSFVDGSYFGQKGIIPISFTLPYASSFGISGSQVLFDGSVLVALKARETVMELARQGQEVTEEGVRYNVYKAYNSLVIAYRQYDIIKTSLSYAHSVEHDVNALHDNGFAEKIDVERTSVQVNNLATDSIRIGNILTVSEQVLKYYMGMDINTPIVLTDTAVEQRKQTIADLLMQEESYNRIPEYNQLNTLLKLNEYNVKRYKLSVYPSLNVFGAYGINTGSNNFNDLLNRKMYYASSTLGLQLNMPIFNGLLRQKQLQEASLNVLKAQNNIDNIKLTIDFQVAQSRTTLKNTQLQLQSQRRNMELSNDVLDLAQKKYKAGVGSNLEVTQAQTDHLQAQTNYFNALLDVINAEADLKKALGLLKE